MKSQPGTYALILRSFSNAKTAIGRWGRLEIVPGFYIYVGSAFGPGGVRARVLRHCRLTKNHHWHIDYLRDFLCPVEAWFSHDSMRLEHQWAQVLGDMSGVSSFRGFGCSDCKCFSHLFYTSNSPNSFPFLSIVGGHVEKWSCRLLSSKDGNLNKYH